METIGYTALAKMIHPDLNPNDPHATDKMKMLNSVKSNAIAVHNLAVKWGIINAPRKSEYPRTHDAFANFHRQYQYSRPEPKKQTITVDAYSLLGKVVKFKKGENHYSGIIFNYQKHENLGYVEFTIFVNNNSIFKIKTADGKNIKVIGHVDKNQYHYVHTKILFSDPYYNIMYGVERNKNYSNKEIYIKVEGDPRRWHKVIRTSSEYVFFIASGVERRVFINKIREFKGS